MNLAAILYPDAPRYRRQRILLYRLKVSRKINATFPSDVFSLRIGFSFCFPVEKEVLDALENAEDYECLSDDFVEVAGGVGLLDDETDGNTFSNKTLWGNFESHLGRHAISKAKLEASTKQFDTHNDDKVLKASVGNSITEEELALLIDDDYDENDIGEVS